MEKIKNLLIQMLPPHALKDLQEETSSTYKLSQVTLMYADIVGFTAWSSTRTPSEVVGMLSELFTRFDKMCLEHNVYKVHTIGDCYVVMGHTGEERRNSAKEAFNVVNFAYSIIDAIEECNNLFHSSLGMRIGVHTGEVIGGITGTNIVRYDIYGQDVMIANKVESNGVQGMISVSDTTKLLLEDYGLASFDFKLVKELQIQEKIIPIYIISK